MTPPNRLALALAAWLLLPLGWSAVSRAGDVCLAYTYLDDRGEMHKTASLDAVPPAWRESMVTFRDCAKAAALRRQGPEVIPPPKGAELPAEKPGADAAMPAPDSSPGLETASGAGSRAEGTASGAILDWFLFRPAWQVVLLILFCAAGFAGELGILVTAFRVSRIWGLLCLLLPFMGLIFVIVRWQDVWPSFVTSLIGGAGVAIMLLGFAGP